MGSYMTLQGLGQNRELFLINGERVIGRVSKRLEVGNISISNVERIEIIRGSQSALYGSDGMGGVIDFLTVMRISHCPYNYSIRVLSNGVHGKTSERS